MQHVNEVSEDTGTPGQGTLVQGLVLVSTAWLAVTATSLIAPVLPQMAAAFKDIPNSAEIIQISVALPALVVSLLSGFWGFLVDRIGRRGLLLFSLILYAAAGLAPIGLSDLKMILLSRAFVGIAEGIVMTAGTTLITDFFSGKRREHWFAAQTGSATLMSVVFVAIGGILGEYGWRAPFFVYLLPLVLFPFVVFTIKGATRRTTTLAALPAPWAKLIAPLIVTLFGAACFYVVVIQISFIMTNIGITAPAQIGLGSAIAAAAVACGSVLFRLLSRVSSAGRLLVSFALSAIGFGGLAYAHDFNSLVLYASINSLGGGLALPTLLTWTAPLLGAQHTGKSIGAWNVAFYMGQFLSPLAVILLTRITGTTQHMFQILSAACAVAWVLAGISAFRPVGRRAIS